MTESRLATVAVPPPHADRLSRTSEAAKLRLRVWLRLLTCTKEIETEIRARLRAEFETTLPRFDVLALLEPEKTGLTMGELSTRLKVTSGNVTGLIDTMEEEGLVMRKRHRTDGRSTLIVATAKGRRLFLTMAPVHHAWIDDILGGVSNADVFALFGLLEKLRVSARLRAVK
jgi:DNA-binding MarR family transcriptional regulator